MQHVGFGLLGNRRNKETIDRRREIPTGDFGAKEVAVAEFPFVAIDFGDTARASGEIRRDAQNIANREPNQCVILHLADGAQRARMKRPQGIPEIQKVLRESEEWRCGEIKQSKSSSGWFVERVSPMVQELRSLARDVINT